MGRRGKKQRSRSLSKLGSKGSPNSDDAKSSRTKKKKRYSEGDVQTPDADQPQATNDASSKEATTPEGKVMIQGTSFSETEKPEDGQSDQSGPDQTNEKNTSEPVSEPDKAHVPGNKEVEAAEKGNRNETSSKPEGQSGKESPVAKEPASDTLRELGEAKENSREGAKVKLEKASENESKKTPDAKKGGETDHHMDVDTPPTDVKKVGDTDHHMNVDTPPTKRTSTLDVVVHRIRHLNFLPNSIVSIRSVPKHSIYRNLLAVSRQNGSVELRCANQKFRSFGHVCGLKSKTVNAMAWVVAPPEGLGDETDYIPKLVGASQDGSLFVVNFASSRIEGTTPSGGGGVFVLQSLYETSSMEKGQGGSLVAAGCEDGSIRIFQCLPDNSLTLVSTVPTTGAAVLSLAWRRIENGAPSSDILSGVWVFAGVADGTIRTYTYQSGRSKGTSWKSVHRMTVETLGRRVPTRIWSLKLLHDWTVVSSDSLGHVQFWDGKTGSLEQTFNQTDQKSDVLDLAVTSDECRVFASGVDSRVVCIERPKESTKDNNNINRRWVMTHAQRPHTHDVKALAVCFYEQEEGGTAISEVLCSGGVDMKLCTYSVARFSARRPRILYPWPAQTPIIVAQKARLFAILKENRAEVHQLGDYESGSNLVPVAEDKTLIGTVEIQTQSSLACGAFSEDGQLMLLCDSYSVYMFELNRRKSEFDPVRVHFEDQPKASVSSAVFVGNDTILIATSNGKMSFVAVESGVPVRKQTFFPYIVEANDPANRLPIHSISPTSSGKCVATICNTYRGSVVDIYVRDEDNTYRHWWTLPKLHSSATAVSFVAKSESRLAVACVGFELYVFDVRQRKLDPWSQSGKTVTGPVPTELATRNDYPVRICTHHNFQEKILLGAFGVFLVVDLSKPPPSRCRTVPETHVRRKKQQKRTLSLSEESKEEQGAEAVQCLRYNSMLYMGFAANAEMIVVEQPWLNVIATLPDALQRKIYGAG